MTAPARREQSSRAERHGAALSRSARGSGLNLIGAAVSGTLVPLGLRLFKIDPALASGVIVTTVTDVTGNLCLLGLATLLLTYLSPGS